MSNETRALAPTNLSLSRAMQACYTACDLGDLRLACSCLQTLLSRGRNGEEDDADTCDGLAALMHLMNESLARREDVAMEALKSLFAIVERERAATPH